MKPLDRILNIFRPQVRSSHRVSFHSGGVPVNPETSPKASAYYRGVTYISTQIAKLPFHIKKLNNELVFNDVYYLLNVAPNPETTAFKFKNFLVQSAINWGNGYAEIERDIYGRPKYLWQIEPHRVTPMRLPDTKELVYQVSNDDGGFTYLRSKDILIFANIYSEDGIHGVPTVTHAAQALGIALGSESFANSLYANGALPSGVLTHKGALSDAAYQRLKEDWNNQMSGKRTGGTVILEEGSEYKPVTHSPAVLQFIETRKFSVPEIARFLGVPPIKLFDMDSAKYGNMEQVHLEVTTDILDVWSINLKSEVDIKLLGGQRTYKSDIDLYSVFRGDMSTRSTYFNKMMQTGAMTPNQIREREGLAPYEEGDRYFLATNNFTPMDRVDEVIDSQINKSETVIPKEDEKETSGDEQIDKIIEDLITRFDTNKDS